MTPFDALAKLPDMVARYEAITARLIEAEQKLLTLQSEKYVPLEWVADLWSVEPKTARHMIKVFSTGRRGQADIKVLSYGAKVVRYRRSDILAITEASLIALKDMLAQKRQTRMARKGKAGL